MRTRTILTCVVLSTLASCGSGTGAPPPGSGAIPPSSGVVELVIADPSVHVGSYHAVEVRIDPASGLTVEDLTFTVPGGPRAAEVSLSKERGASGPPAVMLLVGTRSGAYELVASETATGTELHRMPFVSTGSWADDINGPSMWFAGEIGGAPAGRAWGGGPGTPQNFEIRTALGTQNVAIVLVDSSSQRYTAAEAAATKDLFLDNLFRGVTTDDVTRSAALYYEEVSYGKFTVSGRAFGPYSLPNAFDTYFSAQARPVGNYYAECIELAEPDINYDEFDIILCVMREDESVTPARGAWPEGSGLTYATDEGDFHFGVISMSSHYGEASTIAHEIGHTLGMGDQYDPEVLHAPPSTDVRNIGHWGLMHADRRYPHVTAAHRMRLGWIDRSWVRNIDFSRLLGPVDEDVSLEAIERGAPTSAAHNILEIRIADGLNYYFEYRNPQAGQIGDQDLPSPGSVLGTDVLTPWAMDRPHVLLLEHDLHGDGSVLQAGEDYRETDDTDLTFPADFRVDVTEIEDEVASLRVQYGVLGKPDPSIRPWPAGEGREYQSPDIEIRNARNAADPSLYNVPWASHPNTIVARITNRGTLRAESVVAKFYMKGLTTGGAPEVLRGSDTQTIDAGATVEFSVPWTPPPEGHYCVVVRIQQYWTPTLRVAERTVLNNVAQSNYARFISGTASPASREGTFVIVGNPFPLRTRVHLVCSQSNPYYRTYVEHRWVMLDPGELRRVNVMFEHAGRLPGRGETSGTAKPSEPNRAIIRAVVDDPRSPPVPSPQPFDGVQIRVDTGRTTKTDVHGDDDGVVSGTVRTVDDTEEAAGGRAIVSYENPGSVGRVGHQVVPVVDGLFAAEVPKDWTAIHATYLPMEGLAESDASTTR